MVGSETRTLSVVAGPYVKVEGTGIVLTIAGQRLSGDFAFEKATLTGGATVVKIAATNINLGIGDGTRDFLSISDGQALFVTTTAGLAGSVSGNVAVSIPGVSLSGTISVAINNTNAAVNQTFTVGSQSYTLNLAAGPYLRFEGSNIAITIAEQTLRGNVAFEQVTKSDGSRVVTLAMTSVSLNLGGIALTIPTAGFVITPAGMAGQINLTAGIDFGSVQFSGALKLSINNTAAPVNQSFSAGGVAFNVVLPAGPFFRIEGNNLSLTVAGQTLVGNFAIESVSLPTGEKKLTVAASNVSLSLGTVVSVTNGTGLFLLENGGMAGKLSATVALNLPAGITFSGNFTLAINNMNRAVDQTFTVGGVEKTLQVQAGPYVRVEGTDINLNILGQTLSGNFSFEQVTRTDGLKVTRVAASNVVLGLGDGTTNFVSLTNGQGAFILTAAGIAGKLSGTVKVNIPGVTLGGTLSLSINNTNVAVNESFTVGGETVSIQLKPGPICASKD